MGVVVVVLRVHASGSMGILMAGHQDAEKRTDSSSLHRLYPGSSQALQVAPGLELARQVFEARKLLLIQGLVVGIW